MKVRSSKLEKRILSIEDNLTKESRQTSQLEQELKEMGIKLQGLRNFMDGMSASNVKDNEINILKRRIEELRNEKESMKLEQKKLINLITGLENKIKNKDTDINKLLENNEKLRQDNEKLKE